MAKDKKTGKGGVVTVRYPEGFEEELAHLKSLSDPDDTMSDVIRRAVRDQIRRLEDDRSYAIERILSMGVLDVTTEMMQFSFRTEIEEADHLMIAGQDLKSFFRIANRKVYLLNRLSAGKTAGLVFLYDPKSPLYKDNVGIIEEIYADLATRGANIAANLEVIETTVPCLDFALRTEFTSYYSPYYLFPTIGFIFAHTDKTDYTPYMILNHFIGLMTSEEFSRTMTFSDTGKAQSAWAKDR